MLRTGIVIDPRYEAHDPGLGHPERPARLAALRTALDGCSRRGLIRIEPRSASAEDLAHLKENPKLIFIACVV